MVVVAVIPARFITPKPVVQAAAVTTPEAVVRQEPQAKVMPVVRAVDRIMVAVAVARVQPERRKAVQLLVQGARVLLQQ